MGREVSQGTTTDSGDRNGDKENILPMPRGVDVDVSGAGMGMEKRRIMNEKEENELVDWALKSWGLVLMWRVGLKGRYRHMHKYRHAVVLRRPLLVYTRPTTTSPGPRLSRKVEPEEYRPYRRR